MEFVEVVLFVTIFTENTVEGRRREEEEGGGAEWCQRGRACRSNRAPTVEYGNTWCVCTRTLHVGDVAVRCVLCGDRVQIVYRSARSTDY